MKKKLFFIRLFPISALILFALCPLFENNDAILDSCIITIVILVLISVILFLLPPKSSFKQVRDYHNWYLSCGVFIISMIGIVVCVKSGWTEFLYGWGMVIAANFIDVIRTLRKHQKQK